MKRKARQSSGEVLWARADGVLRQLTATSAGLDLELAFDLDGHPAGVLAVVQRLLRRRFNGAAVVLNEYRVAGTALTAHFRVTATAPPSAACCAALERQLARVTAPWGLRVRRGLQRHQGSAGLAIWSELAGGISDDYRGHMHPHFARRDLPVLCAVAAGGGERFALWGPFPSSRGPLYRLQHYAATAVSLNDLLPLLTNLDLTVEAEHDFVFPLPPQPVWLKSFVVRGGAGMLPLAGLREPLLALFGGLRDGRLENDPLNRLLLTCGLPWRQIDIFRGYRNYYFQLGSPFSRQRVDFALIHNPTVALLLFRYFEARFSPAIHDEDLLAREERLLFPLRLELAAALDGVTDVNADRILRTLFNLIDATVRTNYYRRCAGDDYFFAFKISDLGIIDMPSPRPVCEIYVHAATMEGIHLRGGLVARGGIRWSERPDDFRTEILGLMKTQMAKNVVIVPVGSKGGFVVKGSLPNREEGAQRVEAAYRTLVRGLLDLTDNRVGGRILRPAEVIAYDGDDPYLVVAADKGTATFSDIANAIARDYGFWLDDAFASGGTHGYDHKALAITARGAWECVNAHFRELGRDPDRDNISVVGIGDMSGDVFGNGMLLSPRLRLRAAFDHRHIFLDPDPEPLSAHAERQRLFRLPRSSWDDYDRTLLSNGGGIFPRAAKEIGLSPEVKGWLGCHHDSIDPAGLIRLILCAPVDLLWNGGIGTYVKAASEKHEEVGDRANDAVRVDGGQLRALVVGEGGNLGFTQRGRIEYALAGGRINTDAVDNSGGVDCSDREVNLKIFMQHLMEIGAVSSRGERDRLLAAVSGEVCAAVLADNRAQSLALSLDQRRCRDDLAPFFVLATRLADAGLLDRKGEALPNEAEVRVRPQPLLTRPELAILMAYAKMQLYQGLLDSDLPLHPGTQGFLVDYLPPSLRERFGARMAEHPLARELVATVVANRVVNQGGSALVQSLARTSGVPPVVVVTTYLALDRILVGDSLRQALRSRDGGLTVARTHELLLRLEELLATLVAGSLAAGVELALTWRDLTRLRQSSDTLLSSLATTLSPPRYGRCRAAAALLEKGGLPTAAAWRLAALAEAGAELTAGLLAQLAKTADEGRSNR
ncbi:MAG TPA: NAD-glutamate dehydrogenase [Desulfuromonas sp.]|nr:NAD-glutamate dehydrogenase [Desulfuromonas sp.]